MIYNCYIRTRRTKG